MKYVYVALLAAVVLGCASKPRTVTCPIMGVPDSNPVAVAHDGKEYLVCCDHCVMLLKADPKRYARDYYCACENPIAGLKEGTLPPCEKKPCPCPECRDKGCGCTK